MRKQCIMGKYAGLIQAGEVGKRFVPILPGEWPKRGFCGRGGAELLRQAAS
jgi:hypothetical protein